VSPLRAERRKALGGLISKCCRATLASEKLLVSGLRASFGTGTGHRPAAAKDQASALIAEIAALPRHRPGRQRTSGRTAAERRDGHTEDVLCTISIEKSSLPEWDATPET
jgi:hypothetical protein